MRLPVYQALTVRYMMSYYLVFYWLTLISGLIVILFWSLTDYFLHFYIALYYHPKTNEPNSFLLSYNRSYFISQVQYHIIHDEFQTLYKTSPRL